MWNNEHIEHNYIPFITPIIQCNGGIGLDTQGNRDTSMMKRKRDSVGVGNRVT